MVRVIGVGRSLGKGGKARKAQAWQGLERADRGHAFDQLELAPLPRGGVDALGQHELNLFRKIVEADHQAELPRAALGAHLLGERCQCADILQIDFHAGMAGFGGAVERGNVLHPDPDGLAVGLGLEEMCESHGLAAVCAATERIAGDERVYRQQDCRGECDQSESYTETMFGKLSGRFREPLAPAEKGSVRFEGEISLELTRPVLGIIERFRLVIIVVVDWSLFQSAELLRIQPVFVGSGPSDPNATGTVFNTLMNYSRDMWNRCGTERCLGFVVNEPIYVNNSAYRVLDNDTEAVAFKNSIDVANAVEVFVAERMSTSLACAWGGGACFSGGTASAKVVSCDQQMAVPNPCPTACTSFCPCGACLSGAINPYHLAHELGHALDLPHPPGSSPPSTVNSIMEPSGFCCDNPNSQSAKNCRNAANPLLFTGLSICTGTPDIND